MSKSIIALALLAASATAKLDITKGNSLRGRRRLGKGKHGGGKSGSMTPAPRRAWASPTN